MYSGVQGAVGAETLDICKVVEAQPSLLLEQSSGQESPVSLQSDPTSSICLILVDRAKIEDSGCQSAHACIHREKCENGMGG